MAKQMTYENFRQEAAANDIPNVTQAEYEAHAPDAGGEGPRNWGVMTAFRRIRNARRGVGKAVDVKRLIGFPLGGRDFTYQGMDEVWKQFITVLTPEGLKELDCHGTFKGTHGIRSEFLYEESTTPKKPPDVGVWENRPIKETIIGNERIERAALAARALSVDDLTGDDVYKNVIIKGKISDKWGYEPEFADGEKLGDYPIMVGDQACLYFFIHGQGASAKVRLPPRSLSTAYIDVPDWIAALNEAAAAKHGAGVMAGSFADLEVYVVGNVSRFEDVKAQKGRNYVTIIATAIVALPWQPKQVKLPTEAPAPAPQPSPFVPVPVAPIVTATSSSSTVLGTTTGNITMVPTPAGPATVAPVPPTPAPAPPAAPAPPELTPEQLERKRKATELVEQVKKAIRVLGPNAANKDIGVYLKQQFKAEPLETTLAIAIRRAKRELETEKAGLVPAIDPVALALEVIGEYRMSTDGVTYETVVNRLVKRGVKREDADTAIMDLMEAGKVYEPKIGQLKLTQG